MSLETTKYDAADYLDSPEMVEAYLDAAFETNDAQVISASLGNIARAKGMSSIAAETGLSRASLYKALGENGNPELSTILKVMGAVGLSLKPQSV